jgi:hypothetical protein
MAILFGDLRKQIADGGYLVSHFDTIQGGLKGDSLLLDGTHCIPVAKAQGFLRVARAKSQEYS